MHPMQNGWIRFFNKHFGNIGPTLAAEIHAHTVHVDTYTRIFS